MSMSTLSIPDLMAIAIPLGHKSEGKKKTTVLSSDDIEFHRGMPPSDNAIYKSWQSETLTKKIIQTEEDREFFKLFEQDEKYSCYITDRKTGVVIALSGTSEYNRHFARVKKVAKSILTNKKISTEVKSLVTLHLMSLMASTEYMNKLQNKDTNIGQKFHNTGLLVDEAYRGYYIHDKKTNTMSSVGTYIYEMKLKFLTHPCMTNILCTNANNRGSAIIFNETMNIIDAVLYSDYDIPHEGGFSTFVATLKAPPMKEEIKNLFV